MDADELNRWFDALRDDLETHYLDSGDPYRQSGWMSTPERWRVAREVILEAVPRSGTFLDVGCANGLLLECLVEWGRERGVALVPHGIDFSARLVELARERLPGYAANLVFANAFTWQPERRYDYVHTLLELVPDELHAEYLNRLLATAVAPGGRLIVSSYGSRSRREPPMNVATYLRGLGFDVVGTASAVESDGWVPTQLAWGEPA